LFRLSGDHLDFGVECDRNLDTLSVESAAVHLSRIGRVKIALMKSVMADRYPDYGLYARRARLDPM
jgi:hypothetical protein